MEPVPDPSRDAWMRRTGPFFPLLVAATAQTRLPLASDLNPTEADLARAQPWSPLVGALLGLGLGFFAALIASLGLGDVAVAALAASAWVVASGAWAELGLARHLEGLFARSGGAEDGRGLTAALGLTLSLVVSLLLRVALLSSIDLGAWTGALLVSAAAARFAPLVAENGKAVADAVRRKASPPGWQLIAAAAAVIVVLPIAVGSAAFAAATVAIVAGIAATVIGLRSPAATLVLVVEIASLVCFAAASTYPLFSS